MFIVQLVRVCVCVAEVKCASEKSNKQLVSAERRNQLWLEGALTTWQFHLHSLNYICVGTL